MQGKGQQSILDARDVWPSGSTAVGISARAQEHFNKAVPFTDAGYSQPARTVRKKPYMNTMQKCHSDSKLIQTEVFCAKKKSLVQMPASLTAWWCICAY